MRRCEGAAAALDRAVHLDEEAYEVRAAGRIVAAACPGSPPAGVRGVDP